MHFLLISFVCWYVVGCSQSASLKWTKASENIHSFALSVSFSSCSGTHTCTQLNVPENVRVHMIQLLVKIANLKNVIQLTITFYFQFHTVVCSAIKLLYYGSEWMIEVETDATRNRIKMKILTWHKTKVKKIPFQRLLKVKRCRATTMEDEGNSNSAN